jgi:ribosomal subunit interface protein
MQVIFSIRHGWLNLVIQERIRVKLQKLTRFSDRITEIDVIVDLKNEDAPVVETQISLEHTGGLLAVSVAADVMSAVDQVQHKLQQQLRRHKEKRMARRLSISEQLAWSGAIEQGCD